MLRLSTTILIFLLGFSLSAQVDKWKIETHTVEDGLCSDAVRAILKDRKGFMWFATKMGLQRFDGYDFKTYKYDLNDSANLSHNRISDLFEDEEGNIWIATAKGLDMLNPETDHVVQYLHDANNASSVSEGINKRVFVDSKGIVWVGSLSSLDKLHKDNDTFSHLRHNSKDTRSISGRSVSCIYEDKQNDVWIGTWGGLNKMDRTTGTFQRYFINPIDSTSWSNAIMCIYEDNFGNFWIGTGDGLFLFDRKEGIFSRVLQDRSNTDTPSSQMFTAIYSDPDGNYLVRTFSGLYQYDPYLRRINAWEHELRNPLVGVWENIRSLYPDNNGIIWYTKHYEGIAKLVATRNEFKIYDSNPNNEILSVRSMYLEKKDIIWMGTDKGLSRFDRLRNEYQLFQYKPDDINTISNNGITTILMDHSGAIWVGTADGLNRLELMDDDHYKIKRYNHNQGDPTSISDNYVCQIFESQGGSLYFRFDDKIDVYDPGNDAFLHLQYSHSDRKIDKFGPIICEETGRLWSGANGTDLLEIILPLEKNGQYSITPDTIILHNTKSGGLNISAVTCMHKDRSGTYWFGTEGGGLNKMVLAKNQTDNTVEEKIEYFTKSDGLSSDIVNDIQEDSNGRLWLATENGISRFDPVTESFTNYDKTDGLTGYQFSFKGFKSVNGEMFFPFDKGLLSFHPDSIEDNPIIPPVIITDFRINDKTVPIGGKSPLQKSITYATEIELPHNQNFLSFKFAALNYIHPEKNQYQYKMEGIDQDWIKAGTRRFARYPDLKPGTYTFRVIGSNNDNIWNMEGTSLKVTIKPPWYGTVLSFSGYGILTILLLLGFIRWRTWELSKERNKLEYEVKERTRQLEAHKEEIERQNEILEQQNKKILQIDELKSRFFNNISHEFRTPLTLIQGPLNDLIENARLSKKQFHKLELIARNSQHLLDLVNQLLDISKLESGMMKLKLAEANILAFLRNVTGSFVSMAEAKGILYNRSISNRTFNTFFDAAVLEKIVINLLSNAFKFTPEAGKIDVDVKLENSEEAPFYDFVEISVLDQGPGIPEKDKDLIFTRFYQVENRKSSVNSGTGIGLSIVKDLVNLNHGEVWVESKEGRGSKFIVKLPLGKDIFLESEYELIYGMKEKKPETKTHTAADQQEVDLGIENISIKINEKRPVILVVEDNPELRSHICENLNDDYTVDQAVNGSAGVKKVLENMPDLVITDLIMPELDGTELCRLIKNDERTSHIPVIMLTAKTSLEEKLKGLETGADDYISKPFNMKELKTRISNLTYQRKKLRALFSKEIILKPEDITVTPLDEAFLKKAIKTVQDHISDETFDVFTFQELMNMSHSTLFRKIYALTNLSPSGFITNIRLKRAAQLLYGNFGNIAVIAFEVGFNNPAYFSKCFKNMFGISPAKYKKDHLHIA